MDAARQVIRWSIPGTIFLLVVLFGQLQAALAYGIHTNLGSEVSQSDASLLIVLIGATIPIGFLLYQVYHVFLEEAVSWLPPFSVPLDRGRQILQQLDGTQRRRLIEGSGIKHVDDSDLRHPIKPWQLKEVLGEREVPTYLADASPRQVYAYLRHQNWRAIKWALFNELPSDRSAIVRREYTGFADIYHSIGASRMAVVSGYLALALYDVVVHAESMANAPGPAVLTLVTWLLTCSLTFAVLTFARRHTLTSIQDLVADNLRAYVKEPDEGQAQTTFWVGGRRWLDRRRGRVSTS